ncbi:hypothetical protein LOTGIDRAFT_234981 [Lottia gigantea]|uniref:Saposin B-type domain-containing protein n=1 Tax=Lottia gigantea TaxID=225164 RepID=V3Z9V8_LOTGI|nr:hypothetical protein LOTGIDRAFT_234981 [Lottia gigantea]ESO87753.1 hypothetical protein LOTGIDRAFT_234981 [Lottia gigantea]
MKSLILLAVLAVAINASPLQADLCADCTTLFTDVKTRLADPNTAAAIETQINQFSCDLMLIGKETCQSTVKTIVGTMIGFMAQSIDPTIICTMLQYCQPTPPEPHVQESMDLVKRFMDLTKSRVGGEPDLCADCTNLFTDVKARLANPQLAAGIVASLNKYSCDLIPVEMVKGTCEAITNTLITQGLVTLAGLVDPAMTCAMLQYCAAPTPPKVLLHPEHIELLDRFFTLHGKAQAGDTDLCADCSTLFTDVKTRLTDPATIQAIVAQVEQYSCNLMPIGQETCRSLVSTVIGAGLGMMASFIEPTQICTILGYCQMPPMVHDSFQSTLYLKPEVMSQTVGDIDLCSDCTTLFTDVKTRLSNPQTVGAITAGIEKFSCNLLPTFQTTCNMLVSTAVSTGLGFVASLIDPAMTCQILMYCTA